MPGINGSDYGNQAVQHSIRMSISTAEIYHGTVDLLSLQG